MGEDGGPIGATGGWSLMRLAFHGGGFHGAEATDGARCVRDELRAALRRMGERGLVDLVSRTDAGVHAEGMVAAVQGVRPRERDELLRKLNGQLPADLRVHGVCGPLDAVPAVRDKTYRYQVDLTPWGDPFLADRAWRPVGHHDPDLMHRAAALWVGTHDLWGFHRRGETRSDMQRSILQCGWTEQGDVWHLRVRGRRFLYRQVRSMVGSILAVARGATTLDELAQALEGERTTACDHQAPARGLVLECLRFEADLHW